MLNIVHRVGITADAARIVEALTTIEGIQSWWISDAHGKASQGGAFEFRGGRIEVAEAGPDQVKWRYSGPIQDWVGTDIIFRVEPTADQTVIRFSHEGWREANDILGHCSTKWAMYLLTLKDFVEQGDGRLNLQDARIASDLA